MNGKAGEEFMNQLLKLPYNYAVQCSIFKKHQQAEIR
jgi:hypothetical protein